MSDATAAVAALSAEERSASETGYDIQTFESQLRRDLDAKLGT